MTGPAEMGKCGRVLLSPLLSARPDRLFRITTHTDPTSTCRHRTFLERMALTFHRKIPLQRVCFGKSQSHVTRLDLKAQLSVWRNIGERAPVMDSPQEKYLFLLSSAKESFYTGKSTSPSTALYGKDYK